MTKMGKVAAVFISVMAGAFLVSGKSSADDNKADAVYLGAKIYTASTAAPWAQAIAVKNDRLMYVGSEKAVIELIGKKTTQYDFSGKLILPGLIDAHSHPGYIAVYNQLIGLPEVDTLEQQMLDIAALLKANADKDAIFAIGWDNLFFGIDGPNRQDLDKLDSTRPVLIYDVTMHSLWVNSKALEVSGVGENPEDPVPDVAFFKRDSKGRLTGYITESAATEFANLFFKMGKVEEEILFEFTDYLSSYGVTTLFDAGNFGLDNEVYQAVNNLDKQGRLPVRYYGSYTVYLPQQLPNAITELKRLGKAYNTDKISIDTLKVFFDGVVETRSAHMLHDYEDTPGNRGGSLFSEAKMHQLILDLEREHLNLHVHALGDQSSRTVLNAVESARKTLGRPLDIRVAITHLQIVNEAEYSRYNALDVIAQFTPAWHGYDEPAYSAALGKLAEHPYPVAELVNEGATVSFSSDVYFPSEWEDGSASPFTGMQIGHTRRNREDAPDGPVSGPPSEQLSLEVMVDGYTRGGAWQLSEESNLGTLEKGKKADFVILNEDMFSIDPSRIHALKPAAVVVDGRLVQGSMQSIQEDYSYGKAKLDSQ
ncbi:MAG: putative amidohydrolase YtcJ [Alcanivorax sp.]|jgi:predicted amidohydrolase YtcJ